MQQKQELPTKTTIPIRRDKEVELKKMEIETVNRVISEEDLKTQFSQSERIVLSTLEKLALSPWSISQKIAEDRKISFRTERYRFTVLEDFIKAYARKGKALNRQGIKEDVDIVSAYFQAQIERAKQSNQPSILTK